MTDPEPRLPPRSVLARMPIAVKLPLAAGALVFFIVATLVAAAYITMRNTSTRVADERLGMLADYLASTFSTSTKGMVGQLTTLATNDSIVDYLRTPGPATHDVAMAALTARTRGRGGGGGGTLALQLRDAQGKVLLAAGQRTDWISSAAGADSFPRIGTGDSLAVGALRPIADSLVYPLVARIDGPEPSGYLVQWRQISTVPRLGDVMENLLGSEGTLYFANADGSVWTDFAQIVPPPTGAPAELRGMVRYDRPAPRGSVFAAAAPIAGTPWMWTVEFPAHTVLQPSILFLQRLAVVALCCVALGLLVAWRMSLRLTEPLRQLTAAADAIAAGERGHRLQMPRSDELGRVGMSFDIMASQVDESHQRLEEKVTQRTEALNQALQQLQDTQEALVRREKLAFLGQLASGVGHELRNPLGVMNNAIYYLQMVQPDAPAEVKEYLAILQQQVALSGKIVSDLLDLSRVTPAHRERVTLRQIAEAQLQRLPASQGVTITTDFPDGLPLASVDPVHAGQVVLNLLTNAVQAMGDAGGYLYLRGRPHDDDQLRFEVADTGPGIAADQADKVFEPLYTTKARGIGLGLAVSRSLAQANGGDVFLESTGGPGATFVFIVPIARNHS